MIIVIIIIIIIIQMFPLLPPLLLLTEDDLFLPLSIPRPVPLDFLQDATNLPPR